MVDLPKVPRRIVTVEEPKSSLTRADIQAPYASLASAMQEGSEALSTVAEAGAEEAAARAVVTDAEGNVTVNRGPLPMVGRVGLRYEHYIKVGATAAADAVADKDLIDLRAANKDNPAGFLTSANAYRDQKLAHYTPIIGAAGAAALARQMNARITQTYSGLQVEHQRVELTRADNAIDAQIISASDEMETLARRNGIGDDYHRQMGNVKALLERKVNRPGSTFTSEQADLVLDKLNTRVQGAAILEQTERVYGERGFEAARQYLRGATRALDGKVKSLDQIERSGMTWLRSEELTYRADRTAISGMWLAMKPQLSTTDREQALVLRDQARAVGNQRVADDIEEHIYALDRLSEARQLPASERAFIAVTGTMPANMSPAQKDVQASIENEARRQGIDPNLAVAIGYRESSFNPAAAATTSTAKGVFQLTEANRQRFGVAPDAPLPDQVRAGVSMLKATIAELRTSLGREPTAAEIYMGHFQGAGAAAIIIRAAPDADLKTTIDSAKPAYRGPNGETWGDTVIKANPFLAKMGTVGAFRDWAARAIGAQGAGTDLTQTRGGLLALGLIKKDMSREIGQQLQTMRDALKKEEFPPLDEVIALGEKVYAIGTPEQQREAHELVAIAKVGQQFMTLPAPQRAQALAEADAELKSGAARFDSRLQAALRKADTDITAAYKKDPYGAYYRFSRAEAAQPTPAVDFKDPATAAAILGLRVKQQAAIREEQGLGPFSALRPAEVEAMRGVLAQGDGAATAGVFAALNGLPNDVLAATLREDGVKAGIVGAAHSNDPVKFNATMSALDGWYARDPVGFKQRFGDETWNTLASWQSTLRYLTPEQLTEERTKALDPQAAERRKVNMQKGQELARKHTPDQVVNDLGSGWWFVAGVIQRDITGSQANPPVDAGTRDALMGDYETMFERRYAETLNADTAHQQAIEHLKTKWARSDVNRGRLMLRAPEQVYPQVDGSHGWMTPQLETAIAEQIGVPRTGWGTNVLGGAVLVAPIGGGLPLPARKTNWDYSIVADRSTDTEATRYDRALPVSDDNKPPTYQVMVIDNRRERPQWDVLRGADGKPLRFAFDPDAPRDVSRAGFAARRRPAAASGTAPPDLGTIGVP